MPGMAKAMCCTASIYDVNEGEMITYSGSQRRRQNHDASRTIMGILRKRTGEITFAGRDMMQVPLHKTARAGLGFVPEERGIFATLYRGRKSHAAAGRCQRRHEP